MPKRKGVPAYRLHKARGCAVVTIDGRSHYLGPFGSPESKTLYAEKIAEWQANRSVAPPPPTAAGAAYTIGMLAADYLRFARGYYVKNGVSTKQAERVQTALKALVGLYEELPVVEFGPLKLRTVQQQFVQNGYCRNYVNSLVRCIQLAFRWAAGEEKLTAQTAEQLKYVPSLKRGRTTARETAPIGPVDDGTVNETLKHVSPVVAAMIELQRLTGMRPGEICSLRPMDVTLNLDGTGCYRPESHKTEHHGRERRVYLGPQALAIIKPFLTGREPESCCFTPRESAVWHREQHRQERKTPLYRSHLARYDRKRRSKPKRSPGDRFTVCAYNRAIQRGCEAAFGMPAELRTINDKLPEAERAELRRQAREWRRRNCWSANRLRHSAATRLRKSFGLETAQVVLGHASPNMTLVYAERDFDAARNIMAKIG